jgi:hypothetical protein
MVFQFCSILWLSGSGDELCAPLPTLFQERLFTHPLLALLHFQPLFTESSCRDQHLAPAPFSRAYSTPPPLLCVSVHFLVYSVFTFDFFAGGAVYPGSRAGLSQGLLGKYHVTLCAFLFICQISPNLVWSWHLVAREPSCFLSVMWYGEALYRLGFRVSKFWFSLVFYFCQVWLQCLSKILGLWSSRCLLLHCSGILDPSVFLINAFLAFFCWNSPLVMIHYCLNPMCICL